MIAAVLAYCLTWGFLFQVLAALCALAGQWFIGNRQLRGPILALFGQVMWFCMILTNGTWGLLLSNIPMFGIQGRNVWSWWQMDRRAVLPIEPPLLAACRRVGA